MRHVKLTTLFVVFMVSFWTMANATEAERVNSTPEATRIPPVDQNVELAPGLSLLYYYLSPDTDGVRIRGEVANTLDHEVDSPSIVFTLFDEVGNVLGSKNAYAPFLIIPAKTTMPISTVINDVDISEVSEETFEVCGYGGPLTYVDNPIYSYANLSIEDIGIVVREPGKLQIKGVVRNSGSSPAENVAVKAFVYDHDGQFVGDVWTYISSPIPPGKTARFKVDHGVDVYVSSDPLADAGDDYTYELRVGRDPGVRVAICK